MFALAVVLALVASLGLSPAVASSHADGDVPTMRRGATFYVASGASGGAVDAVFTYGRSSDTPLMCDWNGDGETTPAVVRGSEWHVRSSRSGGAATLSFHYGRAADTPVCGDWNGDGAETPGVVREGGKNLTFLLRNAVAGGPADLEVVYGRVGDLPVTGDWNGDGSHTPAVVRDGRWLSIDHHRGGAAQRSFFFGRGDDAPVVGDWNGDGSMTPGVVRGATWLLRNSNAGGPAEVTFTYGRASDQPLVRYPIPAPTTSTPAPDPDPTPDPDPDPDPAPDPGPDDVEVTGTVLAENAVASDDDTGSRAAFPLREGVTVEALEDGDPSQVLDTTTAAADGSYRLTVPDDVNVEVYAAADGWELPGGPQADTDLLLESTLNTYIEWAFDGQGADGFTAEAGSTYELEINIERDDGGATIDALLAPSAATELAMADLFDSASLDAISDAMAAFTLAGFDDNTIFDEEVTFNAGVPVDDWQFDIYLVDERSNDATSLVRHDVETFELHTAPQNRWHEQANASSQVLRQGYFVDALNGWVGGNNGEIIATKDGGATWFAQDSGVGDALHTLTFLDDALHGWAVGSGPTLLETSDGGASWTEFSLDPGVNDLRAVAFADDDHGWIVGTAGETLHTDDGGVTWNSQDAGTNRGLFGVHVHDSETVWAVGSSNTIVYSGDGGATWESRDPGPTASYRDVTFADDGLTGWVVGLDGLILHTENGGLDWEVQADGGEHLYAVAFLDAETGWATGDGGTMLHTVDGGENWFEQAVADGYTRTIWGVTGVDADNAWAYGGWGETFRWGAELAPIAPTWTEKSTGESMTLNGVHAAHPAAMWAAGGGDTMMHTDDHGATWENQNLTGGLFYDVTFHNDQLGWAVGQGGVVNRTEDGGSTWVRTRVGDASQEWLQAVSFADADNGWAVGDEGEIVHSSDGGDTWTDQVSGASADLKDVVFVDANTGWAVGRDATLIHTTDGGTTWNDDQDPGTTVDLWSVHFSDANTGWIGGSSQTLLATSDGGATWSEISHGLSFTNSIHDISTVGTQLIWGVGFYGTIIHSSDGGTSWEIQDSGNDTDALYGIHMVDERNGWAVGQSGVVLRYAQ